MGPAPFSVSDWQAFYGQLGWAFVPVAFAASAAMERWSAGKRRPTGCFFSLVWTVLYVLAALSMTYWMRDRAGRDGRSYVAVNVLYVLSGLLNAAWTPVFFGRHARPRGDDRDRMARRVALAIALLLFGVLVSIEVLMLVAGVGTDDVLVAAALLAPYTLWSLVAVVMTWYYTEQKPDAIGKFAHTTGPLTGARRSLFK